MPPLIGGGKGQHRVPTSIILLPPKKSSSFGLNLIPVREERARGYEKRREKAALGGRRVLVSPGLVSSYASSQRPPGPPVSRARPGCSPSIPSGMHSQHRHTD